MPTSPSRDAGAAETTPPPPQPAAELPEPRPGATIVAGYDYTCVVTPARRVVCWGLPLGHPLRSRSGAAAILDVSPRLVAGVEQVLELSGGRSHVCARRSDGHVLCWGENGRGEVGPTPEVFVPTPVEVPGVDAAVRIASGMRHTCAIRRGGRLTCWGLDRTGQIGGVDGAVRSAPVDVPLVEDAVDVACGSQFTCVLRRTGSIVCWGDRSPFWGTFDERGRGPWTLPGTPARILGLAAGGEYACAATEDGQVVSWGGTYMMEDRGERRRSLRVVPGVVDAVRVAVGHAHSCAWNAAGAVSCWGFAGPHLGVPGAPAHQPAIVLPSLGAASAVAAGAEHTCAVGVGGEVRCMGENEHGQLGVAPGPEQLVAVEVAAARAPP